MISYSIDYTFSVQRWTTWKLSFANFWSRDSLQQLQQRFVSYRALSYSKVHLWAKEAQVFIHFLY